MYGPETGQCVLHACPRNASLRSRQAHLELRLEAPPSNFTDAYVLTPSLRLARRTVAEPNPE